MNAAVETTPRSPGFPRSARCTYGQLAMEMEETNLPHELWDGELILSPAPSFFHQEIILNFYRALYEWVRERNLGKVVVAPIDMVLSEHRMVQPDVAFVAKERLEIIQDAIMGPADLVAEVVSLGSGRRDRIEKRDLYEQYGVPEYWIIDPEARTVDVLFLAGGRYELIARSRPGELAASRLFSGFTVAPEMLFQAI